MHAWLRSPRRCIGQYAYTLTFHLLQLGRTERHRGLLVLLLVAGRAVVVLLLLLLQ
jgi:hypothetical protein